MPAPDNLLLRYLRRLGAGSLMISVIIHVIILSIATVYVVSSVKEKREAKFQGGSSGPSGPPAQTEHRDDVEKLVRILVPPMGSAPMASARTMPQVPLAQLAELRVRPAPSMVS